MKEQPIKKIRYIFEILYPLANSEYYWILSVITFPLHKIDFKVVIFVKIEEKNDQLDDVIKRRKRHQIIFSNSLINSSNLYLQDLGSEIALSIMV